MISGTSSLLKLLRVTLLVLLENQPQIKYFSFLRRNHFRALMDAFSNRSPPPPEDLHYICQRSGPLVMLNLIIGNVIRIISRRLRWADFLLTRSFINLKIVKVGSLTNLREELRHVLYQMFITIPPCLHEIRPFLF